MKLNNLIKRSIFSSFNIFKKKSPIDVTLFDAYNVSKSWSDDWSCTCDRRYGGPSIVELLMEESRDEVTKEFVKFLRFQGSMNMTASLAKSLGVAGGFCAFRGDVNNPELLDDYQGFEIICKSGADTNIILNMTLDNRTEEDVYQSRLLLRRSDTWKKYHIPLSSFRLTLFGRDRQGQGTFEDSVIESIGMLIRTHQGPFRIDIQSIKLLTTLDNSFSAESEYVRPNFHRIGSASTLSTIVPGNIGFEVLASPESTSDDPNTTTNKSTDTSSTTSSETK